jgi:septum formation protein
MSPDPGSLYISKPGTSHSIPLVLASQSAARKEILQHLGLSLTVDPAHIDETIPPGTELTAFLAELAYRKALEVSRRHLTSLILGADTVIVDDAGIIGKPNDAAEARAILARLSGKSHQVITGLAIIDATTGAAARRTDVSTVVFRSLPPQTIENYLNTGEPFGKAGAYALQGLGAVLIANVQGDYNNVLGLSIASFVDALAELGYELL